MYRNSLSIAFVGMALFSTFSFTLNAQVTKVSLAQMPMYAESTEKGVLVDMSKAIADASGNKLDLQVVPFKRSMDNVITKKVDYHAPLIMNPTIDPKTLKYDHSTETIFHVNFTMYSNKNKKIDKNKLKEYTIETDAAHTQYFPFPMVSSSDLEASLKKVDAGRIDAFIFADQASDPLVKKLGLKNIRRELYQVFDVKIILPKGGAGGATDKMISAAIKKLKDEGKWNPIMSVIDQPFKEW